MSDARLQAIRDIIQEDLGNRGLATDPAANLLTECAGDFCDACHSIADCPDASLAIVTGFLIPRAEPPAGETDGPLGAAFLARSLAAIDVRVAIITDQFCKRALETAMEAAGLHTQVPVVTLPPGTHDWDAFLRNDWPNFLKYLALTHLVALERPGPSCTAEMLQAQGIAEEAYREILPPEHQDRVHTMGGRDITEQMSPAHRLFENRPAGLITVGIGDGGNEIGMGKIPWEIIHKNIPNGGQVACRVPADHLIVAGVSNWGAYGLATGVRLLRGFEPQEAGELYNPSVEEALLTLMVERGPLVDGVTAQPTVTVDGLSFPTYARKLVELADV